MIREITRKQIDIKTAQGERVVLVEAVSPQDYEVRHVAGAVQMVPSNVRALAEDYLPNRGSEIVVYGLDSESREPQEVAEQLQLLGYQNLYLYRGGKRQWLNEGFFQESVHRPPAPGERLAFDDTLEPRVQPQRSRRRVWSPPWRGALIVFAVYVVGQGVYRMVTKRRRTPSSDLDQARADADQYRVVNLKDDDSGLERDASAFDSASGAD